jgi:hypothetical protein
MARGRHCWTPTGNLNCFPLAEFIYKAALSLLICGNYVGSGNAIKHSYGQIFSSVINDGRSCDVVAVDMILRQRSRVSRVGCVTHAVICGDKFITKNALQQRT